MSTVLFQITVINNIIIHNNYELRIMVVNNCNHCVCIYIYIYIIVFL